MPGCVRFVSTAGATPSAPDSRSALPALVAFRDNPTQALIVLVFCVSVQQLESYVLVPTIVRGQVHISPVLVLVALYSSGAIGRILGAIIAVPLAGAARVMIVRYGVPAVRRWTGAAVDRPKPAGRARG